MPHAPKKTRLKTHSLLLCYLVGLQWVLFMANSGSAVTVVRVSPSYISTPRLDMAYVKALPALKTCPILLPFSGGGRFQHPPAPVQHQCTEVLASSSVPCRGSSLKPWQFESHREISIFWFLIFLSSCFSVSLHITVEACRELTLKPNRLVNMS